MKHIYSQSNDQSLFKKVILISTFFILTPIALVPSVISLIAITDISINIPKSPSNLLENPVKGVSVFAALPSDYPGLSGEIVSADARAELVKLYLQKYNSPMEDYAEFMVEISDKYELDWKLLTAIAQKESNLGKRMPSPDCNNAWGYGIHSEGTLCFDTWEEGIETVAKGLKENYIDEGYTNPEEIMKKYAHPSSTSWSSGVLQFMDDMK